jgi:uncharacterized protein (DUF2461 family)
LPTSILTPKQQELIKSRAQETEFWRDEDDLFSRRKISKQFCELINESGLKRGKTISSDQLCQLVELIWQVQSLDSKKVQQLTGLYPFKVYFAGFKGSKDDLKSLLQDEFGTENLTEGVDLEELSGCVRKIASESRDDQGQGASELLQLPGSTQTLVSGFLHLCHEDQYGLINNTTKSPFTPQGGLQVTKDQRTEATNEARSWFSGTENMTASPLRAVFRFEVFLKEIQELCDFEDFHEVDQFIWRLASDSIPETETLMTPILESINELIVKIRRDAEAEARVLINNNLGNLNVDQMRELLKQLNSCLGKNDDVVSVRFGPGFVGNNANLILEKNSELNHWIERLWTAPDEQLPHILDEFWQEDLPGLGRLFPTTILYLRDSSRYFVWTWSLDHALYRVVPGLPSKRRCGYDYREYCRAVRQLRKKIPFPPEMHDWILSCLSKKKNTKKPDPTKSQANEFKGFTVDTFRFMQNLVKNNNQQWFDVNKPRFRKAVDLPLRALVKDIGSQVMTPLDPQLETSAKTGKCISRIRKNVWGKKSENVFQELYWAAFYRRERSKQTDCQFFLTVRPNYFQHGLFFGEEADDVRDDLIKAFQNHQKLGEELFQSLQVSGFLFAEGDSGDIPEPIGISDYSAFCELIRHRFHVYRRTTPEDSIEAGEKLVEQIGKDFQSLYPLFLMATSDDPGSQVRQYLKNEKDDEEESELGEEITLADLAGRTFLSEDFFSRLDQLLQDKQQLILCGPPGTSKTYVALQYAEYLTQEAGEVRTVQFHPSYGYEDFIEGLRPDVKDGALIYRVEDGIFKQFCNTARSNPKGRYVLLIDEINRGNLPRIFGELLFLLERREEKTTLPYSKKPFSIPRNIWIVGTMNTSDSSIAHMDLALRRRFHFVSMHPSSEVLGSWLKVQKKPLGIRMIFEKLNSKLRGAGIEEDRLVGHAHFMSTMLDQDHLELIWEGTVHPLLREIFFTQPERLQEFTLEKLKGNELEEFILDDFDEEIDEELEAEDADEDLDDDLDEAPASE